MAIFAAEKLISPIAVDKLSVGEFKRGTLDRVQDLRVMAARMGIDIGVLYGLRYRVDGHCWLTGRFRQSVQEMGHHGQLSCPGCKRQFTRHLDGLQTVLGNQHQQLYALPIPTRAFEGLRLEGQQGLGSVPVDERCAISERAWLALQEWHIMPGIKQVCSRPKQRGWQAMT